MDDLLTIADIETRYGISQKDIRDYMTLDEDPLPIIIRSPRKALERWLKERDHASK